MYPYLYNLFELYHNFDEISSHSINIMKKHETCFASDFTVGVVF